MLLPSGKYRGLPVRFVPDDYLTWYYNEFRGQMSRPLEDAIEEEFDRRHAFFLGNGCRVDLGHHIREALELGFRELRARRYACRYPDDEVDILDRAYAKTIDALMEILP